MKSDPDAIPIRLTANQVLLIWCGLDLVVGSHAQLLQKKVPLYSYPFRLLPPPQGFNRGQYNWQFMQSVLDLLKRLRAKKRRGGRFQLNTIEIRAAIFGVRIYSDWERFRRNAERRLSGRKRTAAQGESPTVKRLKAQLTGAIRTLERHLKRANYRLLAHISRASYDSLMASWRSHVRWMRLHLAYFQSIEIKTLVRRKRIQQAILNDLVTVAAMGIQRNGYELPDAVQLRKVMRQYLAYTRRGRLPYVIIDLLKLGSATEVGNVLCRFVEQRLTLVEIDQ